MQQNIFAACIIIYDCVKRVALWQLCSVRLKKLSARVLQALSNPYCQSTCLSVCVSATLMLNISETKLKGFVSNGDTVRKVPTVRRLVTSSMTSSDYGVILVASQSSK